MDFCCNVEKLFTILIGIRSQYECGQFMPSSCNTTNANTIVENPNLPLCLRMYVSKITELLKVPFSKIRILYGWISRLT